MEKVVLPFLRLAPRAAVMLCRAAPLPPPPPGAPMRDCCGLCNGTAAVVVVCWLRTRAGLPGPRVSRRGGGAGAAHDEHDREQDRQDAEEREQDVGGPALVSARDELAVTELHVEHPHDLEQEAHQALHVLLELLALTGIQGLLLQQVDVPPKVQRGGLGALGAFDNALHSHDLLLGGTPIRDEEVHGARVACESAGVGDGVDHFLDPFLLGCGVVQRDGVNVVHRHDG
mmetsp:Transcript_15830/g.53729  ORF Transcript_15830/g.53729 Transcript_15830/m.53729 type:complete len:229 (+) Transcript_15830:838-1524(+)